MVVNRTRRSWKPNVQEKRLFSYILDRHIRVKVTTHALRCIDKAGGIDEYLLKTPYHKMDTEMGLFWKAKIEKMYEELGEMDVVFFSPEDEVKFEQGFKELKLAERAARREARRQIYGGSGKQVQLEEGGADIQETNEVAARVLEGSSHVDAPEQLVANTWVGACHQGGMLAFLLEVTAVLGFLVLALISTIFGPRSRRFFLYLTCIAWYLLCHPFQLLVG